jgi:multicomponent Na+:H+ antiporter subunit D
VAYLLPVVARGFFVGKVRQQPMAEAPILCWLPPAITAAGCVILFFLAGRLQTFLSPIAAIQ